MNQPETTLRKARALAKSLGHDLVRFRKTHTHAQTAYCRHCFKYAFIDGDDVRGGAVSEGCHRNMGCDPYTRGIQQDDF